MTFNLATIGISDRFHNGKDINEFVIRSRVSFKQCLISICLNFYFNDILKAQRWIYPEAEHKYNLL